MDEGYDLYLESKTFPDTPNRYPLTFHCLPLGARENGKCSFLAGHMLTLNKVRDLLERKT